jgi:predicted LPLAT superfamily acyltransferase
LKTLRKLRRADALARRFGIALVPPYEPLCLAIEAVWSIPPVRNALIKKLRPKLPQHPFFAPGATPEPGSFERLFSCRVASHWRLAALDLCRQETVRRCVRVTGREHLEKAGEAGKGVVLVGAHYGAAHLLSIVLNRVGIRNAVVGKFRQQAKQAVIQNIDLIALSRDDPVRPLLLARERLKAGETVLITGDGPYGQRIRAPFLGSETGSETGAGTGSESGFRGGFPQGFATLALATGAPLVPAFAIPGRGGRITVEFHEPLDPGERSSPRKERVLSLVEQYARILERKWLGDPALVWWQGEELRPPLPWKASYPHR